MEHMFTNQYYLPAAGRDWALPLYDPLVKLVGIDAVRRGLLDRAALRPGNRVLDIGCGTGTLAAWIKTGHPGVDVVGLDPDPKALARARRKAAQARASIRFDRGFSDAMPYPDASFDCVFSSFMFHHLNSEAKDKTLREVRRVLVPGGSFHLLDFAGPDAGARGLLAHLIRSHLDDNSESRILRMMGKAGLRCSEGLVEARVLFGALIITYFHATTLTPAAAIEGLR